MNPTGPRPPSVLQLVTRRQLRGAEVFAAELSEHLLASGLAVSLIGLYPPGDPPLEVPGIATFDLHPRVVSGISPRLIVRLAQRIRRIAPDIVQANGSDTLKYAVLARALSLRKPIRKPILIYRNISIASRWLRTPLHRLWNRRLLHTVDHVVAVSERSREDLQLTYGLPENRITVLPRAVETRFPEPDKPPRTALAQATGCDPEAPLIVHIGSFTPEKNHRGMLEVLLRVHQRLAETQLVFFGDGPLREQTRVEAEHRGLADRIFFPGSRADAAALAAGADLLLLFSRVEGMPGVVLEAGARGIPVVVSDVGGVREVVTEGTDGRIVPSGDVAACAEAISGLLSDAELRHRLGVSLRDTVRERYDLRAIVKHYESLYRSLLDEDPKS